ncbi:hypothetical protein ACIQVO_18690 [Streptomyces sp. NPDC101062]|uniref:hypothetical protein n=1 Tax=unclassified Streptomyces TaxID=2593676 RepID=UPI002E75A014|nr:hypothetical protein [Streptomyces sp. JV176]MEE1802541.1 hypothetical protein [Streptomyces sp. JV176]
MDGKNLFETQTTYRLIRLEYGLGLVIAVAFFFANIGEVRWIPAIALFVYIDLIGYIPGAIAYHRSKTKRIHRGYYVAYNVMHSLATQTLVVLAWIWLWGPEWALLVIPIHLFGDRALFGNFLKPFALDFEPVAHPAYSRFTDQFAATPATHPEPAGGVTAAAGQPQGS